MEPAHHYTVQSLSTKQTMAVERTIQSCLSITQNLTQWQEQCRKNRYEMRTLPPRAFPVLAELPVPCVPTLASLTAHI